jgi:flavorubredoxin
MKDMSSLLNRWIGIVPDTNEPTLLFKDREYYVYWLGITNETAFRCNCYLIISDDEAILIDPGGKHFFGQVFNRVSQVIDPKKVSGMILSHQDPDIAASMTDWIEFNKNIKVFSTPRTHVLLPHYGIEDYQHFDVEENKYYPLSNGKSLRFYPAPFLHFPGAFVTYDEASGFLFSGDIWASLDSDWKLVIEDFDVHSVKMDLFNKDYMSSNIAASFFAYSIKNLDIKAILPQHGSIIPKNFVKNAIKYLEELECGIDLFYANAQLNLHLGNDDVEDEYNTNLNSELQQIHSLLDKYFARISPDSKDHIYNREDKLLFEIIFQNTRLASMRDKALHDLKITMQKLKNSEVELRQKEDMIIAQSRLAAMGEMISMIAHQWRQPISTIGMAVNNIKTDIELDMFDIGTCEAELDNISNIIKHLSDTINDFRNFFKTAKEYKKTTVNEAIKEALKIVEKSLENHNIKLCLELKSSKELQTLKNDLIQVLLNIISNAKDILIEKNVKEPVIKITTFDDNNNVNIVICDNGGGVMIENIDKIFEPYFTTKGPTSGTGLGLYMSKMIIESHLEGEICVENSFEGGCFKIKL